MDRGEQRISSKDFSNKIHLFRDVNSLWKYLEKEIQSPIINITSDKDLTRLNLKGKSLVAYFNEDNNSISQIYSKVANLLRDDCLFIQMINRFVEIWFLIFEFFSFRWSSLVKNEIISYDSSTNERVIYNGSFSDEEFFYIWSNKQCERLLDEITFENAEELTEQSIPLLLLFHHPNDQNSIHLFEKQILENLHQLCNKSLNK